MTRTEIENLNNEVITKDVAEEIELHEDVESFECMGDSSSNRGCQWFSVEFKDGESIDVFTKNDAWEN